MMFDANSYSNILSIHSAEILSSYTLSVVTTSINPSPLRGGAENKGGIHTGNKKKFFFFFFFFFFL